MSSRMAKLTVPNLVRGEERQIPLQRKWTSRGEQWGHIIPLWLFEQPSSKGGGIKDRSLALVAPHDAVSLLDRSSPLRAVILPRISPILEQSRANSGQIRGIDKNSVVCIIVFFLFLPSSASVLSLPPPSLSLVSLLSFLLPHFSFSSLFLSSLSSIFIFPLFLSILLFPVPIFSSFSNLSSAVSPLSFSVFALPTIFDLPLVWWTGS